MMTRAELLRLEFIRAMSRHELLGCLDVVSLQVLTQVIAAHETLPAVVTGESLFARVCLEMALQLIGSRE